ncbi:hypothetical protein [Tsukamurella soli]|uniref:Uncharacterized protein n=1 Tax=Tsukamurella soli TaxID=644556 RepID=A0ABP8JGA9_9ACTN
MPPAATKPRPAPGPVKLIFSWVFLLVVAIALTVGPIYVIASSAVSLSAPTTCDGVAMHPQDRCAVVQFSRGSPYETPIQPGATVAGVVPVGLFLFWILLARVFPRSMAAVTRVLVRTGRWPAAERSAL